MKFTLYTAKCRDNLQNCVYPDERVITSKKALIEAVRFDHVTACYKENYRNKANFIKSDCLPLDCDNEQSDKEKDWIKPQDVAKAFTNVPFAVVYSRNNMKSKGGKSARPRFHVYFQIPDTTDQSGYADLKQQVAAIFPYFDANALDAARFLFGVKEPEVEIFDGDTLITDYLSALSFAHLDEVPEGRRNSTMSHIAGKLIKRYGNTDEAYELFKKKAENCNPPLEDKELNVIWHSAVKFGKVMENQEGYIPPEKYNSECLLKPNDFSDVGQAEVLEKEYNGKLRYSPQTDYIVYNGSFWEESKPKSQRLAQELTTKQMEEADREIKKSMKEMSKNGSLTILATMGPKKAISVFNKEQRRVYEIYENANAYKAYAIKRRDSKNITACLREAVPMLEINPNMLDGNENLLNTPTATYDLKKGVDSAKEHDPKDFITKQTTVNPSDKNADMWLEALKMFFCEDMELIDYVQRIVGLAAIGKVFQEALIISFGEGSNGKSTFWNSIASVFGTYSGTLSADVLTVACRRNTKPELAEAKGKRLMIAAEMQEGMRLNTSIVKQLCSTDKIQAEKKYKDPFNFQPTHSVVLYTNHLPKVGAIDNGTWRRIIVLPFNAKIEGKSDIKNYSDYLVKNAGGAILAWIIEGARRVIAGDHKIVPPRKVAEAIAKYRENNNWLGNFLEECCEVGEDFYEKSGDIYNEYRSYCMQNGEFVRSTSEFYASLEQEGFSKKRTPQGRCVLGLKLKAEFL